MFSQKLRLFFFSRKKKKGRTLNENTQVDVIAKELSISESLITKAIINFVSPGV